MSSGFIFLFVLFGALLNKAGAGNYFIKSAFALLGHMPGGPAARVFGYPWSNIIQADVLASPNRLLYRSTNAGAIWSEMGVALAEHTISSAFPDILYAGEGYPCYAGGDPTPFWRTTNGGPGRGIDADGRSVVLLVEQKIGIRGGTEWSG